VDRRKTFTIFLIVLTDIIGFGIVIPLLPQITKLIGISDLEQGFLLSSYAIAQFFAAPFLGTLSDRYGRRPVLIVSKIGTVIAYVIFAFAKTYPLLLLSRMIDGFTGGNLPVARAYVADITTVRNRSRGMALIGIAFGLGFIIGPAVGGVFYTLGGNSVVLPLLVGAGLSGLSALLTWAFLPETVGAHARVHPLKLNYFDFLKSLNFQTPLGKLIWVNLIANTLYSGFQTALTFFTLALFAFTPSENSLLLIYIGLLSFFIQGFFARYQFKQVNRGARLGLILSGIAMMLVAISPNRLFFYLFLAINSLGSSLVGILLPTLVSEANNNTGEGQSMGTLDGTGSLGRIFGPLVAGWLVSVYPRPLYFALGLLLLPSYLLISHLKPQKAQTHQSVNN
jgi:DHA1 family tetracycline resistance protein-like MFS transporter